MRRTLFLFLLAALLPYGLSGQSVKGAAGKDHSFSWTRTQINGSRTGCSSPGADNIAEAVGSVRGKTYVAPNGRVFKGGTIAEVAGIVLAAQPAMAPVKEVVGYSPEAMVRTYPECALSNLFIDRIMAGVANASGRQVDMGVGNFGGIRVDMPKGDILKDDIMSMFPFKNNIVYLSLKGKDIMAILENMAATRFQVLGGVRVVAEDGKVISAEIGGKPVEMDKVYGVATISFLLNGGDDLFLAKDALEVSEYQIDIYDVIMDYIREETAAGRPIVYQADGRVVIR